MTTWTYNRMAGIFAAVALVLAWNHHVASAQPFDCLTVVEDAACGNPPSSRPVHCCSLPVGIGFLPSDYQRDPRTPTPEDVHFAGVQTSEQASARTAKASTELAVILGRYEAIRADYSRLSEFKAPLEGDALGNTFGGEIDDAPSVLLDPSTWRGEIGLPNAVNPDGADLCGSPGSCVLDDATEFPKAQGSGFGAHALPASSEALGAEVSDPISLVNGEFVVHAADLEFPGFGVAYSHARVYRSRVDYDGPLGPGWDHSYNERLLVDGERVLYATGEARTILFAPAGRQATSKLGDGLPVPLRQEHWYASPSQPGVRLRASYQFGQLRGWTMNDPGGVVSTFDAEGLLTRREDANGNGLSFSWRQIDITNGGVTISHPRLALVTDSVGREISYEYDSSARLLQVTEARSGLHANYEHLSGALHAATNSKSRRHTYEYGPMYIAVTPPEADEWSLRRGCELACAPTESDVMAGGACDQASEAGPAACVDACETSCDVQCESNCAEGCGTSCRRACSCPSQCRALAQATCDELWESHYAEQCDNCYEYCATWGMKWADRLVYAGLIGTDIWGAVAGSTAMACAGFYPNGRDCPGQLCNENCREGFFGRRSLQCLPELGGQPMGCLGSVQDLCENGVATDHRLIDEPDPYSTRDHCEEEDVVACATECQYGEATEGCVSECNAGCGDTCKSSCDLCLTDERNYLAACQTSCVGDCVGRGRLEGGRRYGEYTDLNYNIVAIRDGNGVEFVRNEYGVDPVRPDFDSVIVQRAGDGETHLAYLDLEASVRSPVGPTDEVPLDHDSLGPSGDESLSSYAERIDEIELVDICPTRACDFDRVALGPDTYVPYRGYLIVFSGVSTGLEIPYRVSGPGNTAPPDHLSLELLRVSGDGRAVPIPGPARGFASRTTRLFLDAIVRLPRLAFATPVPLGTDGLEGGSGTESVPDPLPPASFELHAADGAVTRLWKRSDGTYDIEATGPWASFGEITLVRENSGIVRVIPGRPTSALLVSEGACTRAFSASLDTWGALNGPQSSCSDALTVSPLASVVDSVSTVEAYRAGQQDSPVAAGNVLAEYDAFLPTPLTPERYSMRWIRGVPSDAPVIPNPPVDEDIGGSSFDPRGYVGSAGARSGAPADAHWRAAIQLPIAARVFGPPSSNAPASEPLYAFHVPRAESDAAMAWFDGVALDNPNSFDASARPACQRATVPVRAPARATVVRDVYDAIHVYYWTSQGALAQQVQHDTGIMRRFNVDDDGRVVAIQGPLGERSCATYDGDADLVRLERHGVPDAAAPLPPIVQTFAYTAQRPKRPTLVSDPNEPASSLWRYEWDERGNATAVIDAEDLRTVMVPSEWGIPMTVTSPDGVVTRYDVDESVGLVSTITHGVGGPDTHTRTTEFDSAGRPVFAADSLGVQTTWTWDSGGTERLLSSAQTSADGLSRTAVFRYDADGELREVDNGRSLSTVTHDATGSPRCFSTVSLDGSAVSSKRASYAGPDGRLLADVDENGQQTLYLYDSAGRLTSARVGGHYADPCGAPVPTLGPPSAADLARPALGSVAYDDADRVIARTDGRGISSTLSYDAHGRTDQMNVGIEGPGAPPQLVLRWQYDARGQVVAEDAYDGAVAATLPSTMWSGESFAAPRTGEFAARVYTYDRKGRLETELAHHFDDVGALLGIGGTGIASTFYEYDDVGRSFTVRRPVSSTETLSTRFERDELGRATRTVLPTGDEVLTSYHDNGRTIREDAPTPTGRLTTDTHLTTWGAVQSITTDGVGVGTSLLRVEFDPIGRPHTTVSASGAASTYTYDSNGRVTQVANWLDDPLVPTESVTYAWDAAGLLDYTTSDVARGAGRHVATTDFDYDELARLRATTHPDGSITTRVFYGTTGLASLVIDPLEVANELSYDALGNVTGITANAGEITAERVFERDALGRMASAHAIDASGTPDGQIDSYFAWDSLGASLGEWNSELGETLGVRHVPDPMGRPVESSFAGQSVTRSYDGLGRLRALNLGARNLMTDSYGGIGGPVSRTLGSGVTRGFGYDSLGRLDSIADTAPAGDEIARWAYGIGLDGVPRYAERTRLGQRETSVFHVDRGGRLLGENHGITASLAPIAPDASWETASAAVAPELETGARWRSYELDGRGNWLSASSAVAFEVTPSVGERDAYTSFAGVPAFYNDAGALTGYSADGYEYDLFGTLAWATRGDAGRAYAYDALGRVVREEDIQTGEITRFGYDGASRAIRVRDTGVADVTLDNGLDEHIVTIVDGAREIYYHGDRLGSVYLTTDVSGRPLEWYDYTAFGELTILSPDGTPRPATAVGNRFGFQGHPHDAVTGLVEMRARFYRPQWGRFLSPDPIGLSGGTNPYAFVGGAPTAWLDPFGLSPKEVAGSLGLSPRLNSFWFTPEEAPYGGHKRNLARNGLLQKHGIVVGNGLLTNTSHFLIQNETYIVGTTQVIGGASEFALGAALWAIPGGQVAGAALMAKGADGAGAGVNTWVSGEIQETALATYAGPKVEEYANYGSFVAGLMIGVARLPRYANTPGAPTRPGPQTSSSRGPNEIFGEASDRIPGQSIRPRNLYRELRKSEIGRETLDLIEKTKTKITLTPIDPPTQGAGTLLFGRALNKSVTIFTRNTKSLVKTAQTAIHEVTHTAGIRGTQRAEVIAEIRAFKHLRVPTMRDIRDIIARIKRDYPELPYE